MDRVLDRDGNFVPFPERLKNIAIRQGNLAPDVDTGEPEDLLPDSGAKGKLEIAKRIREEEKAQAEMDKLIKQQKAAEAARKKAENLTVQDK